MTRNLAADLTTEKDAQWSRPFSSAVFKFGGSVGNIYVSHDDMVIGGNAHEGAIEALGEFRSLVVPEDGVFQVGVLPVQIVNLPIFGSPKKRFTDLWSGIGIEGIEVDVFQNYLKVSDNTPVQELIFAGVMRPGEYTPETSSLELFSICEKYLDQEVSFLINQTDLPLADLDEIGKPANIIYGSVKKAVAHAVVAAPAGVLRANMTTSATTVPIHDDFHDTLPTSGTIQTGNEKMDYTGKGGSAGSRTLTGLTRPAGGTPLESHVQDDTIFQVIASYDYMVAGHEMTSIDQVYIKRQGKIIPIASSDYTVELNNTTLISGKTVTLVKFPAPPTIKLKEFTGISDTHAISQSETESKWTQVGTDKSSNLPVFAATQFNAQTITLNFPSQEKTKSSGSFVTRFNYKLMSGSVGNDFKLGQETAPPVQLYDGNTEVASSPVTVVHSTYGNLVIRRRLKPGEPDQNSPAMTLFTSSKTVEYNIAIGASVTGSVALTNVSSADVVIGDQVLIDGDGQPDDGSGTYTGTADALIEKPADVMHHVARVHGAIPASRIDAASFTTARTDAPASYKFAGVLTLRSTSLRELLLSLGMQSRTRIEWPVDQVTARFLKSTYPAAVKTLTKDDILATGEDGALRGSLTVRRGKVENLVNVIDLHYGRRWSEGREEDDFDAVTSDSNSASITKYGERKQPGRFLFDFVAKDNSSMADDLLAFYLARYKEPPRLVDIESFLRNFELLPGDIVALDYLVGTTEKFDGLDGTQKILVEAAGLAPGILSEGTPPLMDFLLREVA